MFCGPTCPADDKYNPEDCSNKTRQLPDYTEEPDQKLIEFGERMRMQAK